MTNYRDKTFCSINCANDACSRNVKNINPLHFRATKLPLSLADLSDECGTYIETSIDNFKYLRDREDDLI